MHRSYTKAPHAVVQVSATDLSQDTTRPPTPSCRPLLTSIDHVKKRYWLQSQEKKFAIQIQ